ncbi:MAG TPA: pyridoxal phosphate-dependent aminotransferase [Hyphomonadaceae bacterium]|jgi:aspartate/methionine/tyrosine aminotransferase|nr:pyridoxal phosphate-dependent aminotransferase [Hyphomonadaceae bacterium]
MTSRPANSDPADLFSAEDYTLWCRRLNAHIPTDGSAAILFDSTISEPADLLRQVILEAFESGISDRFVSVFGHGNRFLNEALSTRYGVDPSQLVCATGATTAITMALRILPEDRRRVVIEAPRLDLLHHLPQSQSLEIDELPRRGDDFGIDPDDLRKLLRRGAGMVLLTNPHNPSGRVMPAQRLAQIADVAEEAGSLVLVDEVYSDLWRDAGFTSAVQIAPNMVSVNSLSKSFGLFSLRCGWIMAAPAVARRIEAANTRIEFGASKVTHALAAHVLQDMTRFDAYWRGVLRKNRPILEQAITGMKADGLIEGDPPAAGCMYFPRITDVSDTQSLARQLWADHRVLVGPGEYFGQPGHVRLGFGMADGRLGASLGRLHEALLAIRNTASGATRRRAP